MFECPCVINRNRNKLTCSEKEDANMVDRTGIRELEISMSFVDLLEVCLQETTSYAASEHDVFLRDKGISDSEGY